MFVKPCNLLLVLCLLAVLGCGGEQTIHWSGEVTFEGAAVESGIVRFEPVGGAGQTAGGPIVQGKYSVQLTPGKYTVDVTGTHQVGTELAYAGSDETYPVVEELGTYRETVEVTANEVRNFSLEKP
jgi:hypothetical protein